LNRAEKMQAKSQTTWSLNISTVFGAPQDIVFIQINKPVKYPFTPTQLSPALITN
jgi:hypothetical protein